jgi:endonuclease YncB( thermonuclease family)
MGQESIYSARVEEVHSGDDLVLLVDLGVDGLFKRVRARLKGVDAPSAFKADHDSEACKVRDAVRAVTKNVQCSILLHSYGKGGWVVTLFAHTSHGSGNRLNVNRALIEQGYVYKEQ